MLWLDDRDALRVTNELRYLNHAPRPNAEIDPESLEVRALRLVRKGEEITIDYGPDWD